MNKEEFVNALSESLKNISEDERKSSVNFYTEMIDDRIEEGMTEEKAVEALGSIDNIADEIKNDIQTTSFVSKEKEDNNIVKQGEITGIHIEDINTAVEIVRAIDGKVNLSYFENSSEKYLIQTEHNGILNIKKVITKKWYQRLFQTEFGKTKLTVALPPQLINDAYIKTSNASIRINDLVAKNITAITSNSVIKLNNLTASENIFIKTSNARCEIMNLKSKNIMEIVTSNGGIDISDIGCKELRLVTSNAKIHSSRIDAAELMKCRSSNGEINFDCNSSDEINCSTSNAKIIGFVRGDIKEYTIDASTSNSACNLPSHLKLGEKYINIQTSNGKIQVDFSNGGENN